MRWIGSFILLCFKCLPFSFGVFMNTAKLLALYNSLRMNQIFARTGQMVIVWSRQNREIGGL